MIVHKILCPVDFSESSKAAVAFASAIAKDHDAEIHIVYSYESTFAFTDGPFPSSIPPADLEHDHLALAKMLPTEGDVRFRHEFLHGPPVRTLLDYAAENDIDLIVLGTHGRTGIARMLMGSVAESIVRSATCPVITVKTPASLKHDDVDANERSEAPS